MRYLALVAVAVLGGLGFMLPAPDAPSLGAAPDPAASIFGVCSVEEGSGRSTEITGLSTVGGPVHLTLFASGGTVGSIGVETGAAGSVVIPVGDVAAVGTVGGLLELPSGTSAAGTSTTGNASMSVEGCQSTTSPQTYVTGGTSAAQAGFQLHLMNPFAAEALVRLTVTSETGIEVNDRFETVIVPSRGFTIVDLSDLVPGRQSLSVRIDTIFGRVVAVAKQEMGSNSALWNAHPPAQDWLIPVPSGDMAKRLILGNPSEGEIEFQADLYGPNGLEEAAVTGAIPASGQTTIDVNSSFGTGALGVRVITTAPIVTTLAIEGPTGLARSTGAAEPVPSWALPGAGLPSGGSASMVILNPGIEDVDVSIRPVRAATSTRGYTLPAGGVLEIGLEVADGYLVDAGGPVAVSWASLTASSAVLSIGVPLPDG